MSLATLSSIFQLAKTLGEGYSDATHFLDIDDIDEEDCDTELPEEGLEVLSNQAALHTISTLKFF